MLVVEIGLAVSSLNEYAAVLCTDGWHKTSISSLTRGKRMKSGKERLVFLASAWKMHPSNRICCRME